MDLQYTIHVKGRFVRKLSSYTQKHNSFKLMNQINMTSKVVVELEYFSNSQTFCYYRKICQINTHISCRSSTLLTSMLAHINISGNAVPNILSCRSCSANGINDIDRVNVLSRSRRKIGLFRRCVIKQEGL